MASMLHNYDNLTGANADTSDFMVAFNKQFTPSKTGGSFNSPDISPINFSVESHLESIEPESVTQVAGQGGEVPSTSSPGAAMARQSPRSKAKGKVDYSGAQSSEAQKKSPSKGKSKKQATKSTSESQKSPPTQKGQKGPKKGNSKDDANDNMGMEDSGNEQGNDDDASSDPLKEFYKLSESSVNLLHDDQLWGHEWLGTDELQALAFTCRAKSIKNLKKYQNNPSQPTGNLTLSYYQNAFFQVWNLAMQAKTGKVSTFLIFKMISN